jgi:TonB family protein
LAAFLVVFVPKPAAADDTDSGVAAPHAACDMAPYEAQLQSTLDENEAGKMQEQGMLFLHLSSNDPSAHIGVVVFDIAADGHVVDAKLQQSTGSKGLDVLLLSAVRNSKFGSFPTCFPNLVMPVKFRFDIPANIGD